MEVALPHLARVFSLWEFLVMKVFASRNLPEKCHASPETFVAVIDLWCARTTKFLICCSGIPAWNVQWLSLSILVKYKSFTIRALIRCMSSANSVVLRFFAFSKMLFSLVVQVEKNKLSRVYFADVYKEYEALHKYVCRLTEKYQEKLSSVKDDETDEDNKNSAAENLEKEKKRVITVRCKKVLQCHRNSKENHKANSLTLVMCYLFASSGGAVLLSCILHTLLKPRYFCWSC